MEFLACISKVVTMTYQGMAASNRNNKQNRL